jgi:predicted RNA-binding protein with PIN domain
MALVRFLARHLPPQESNETTVVFDAKRAPTGRDTDWRYQGLRILFAREQDEADDLIEQQIRNEAVPRKLRVVTNDLRIQTAARRRRAIVSTCDEFLDWLEEQPRAARNASESAIAHRVSHDATAKKNASSPEPSEVAWWLAEFRLAQDRTDELPADSTDLTPQDHDAHRTDSEWSPFPSGYGDDLLNEEAHRHDPSD